MPGRRFPYLILPDMQILKILVAAALVGCGGSGAERLEGHSPSDSVPGGVGDAAPEVIDSVLPGNEALDHFRADIAEVPTELRGVASSPEALLGEVLDILAAHDTAGFERIALDRAEFAYLYYPSSPLSRAPYQLPPELAWFRMQQENRIGVLRMLREMGGSRLRGAELVCLDTPTMQGRNRIWTACRVRTAGGEDLRLFGALIERNGRWKVITFANDF